MTTTLVRHGDEYALIIGEALMKQLNIRPDTRLEITPEAESFSVTSAEDAEDEALFQKALEETNREYGSVLKKLAE